MTLKKDGIQTRKRKSKKDKSPKTIDIAHLSKNSRKLCVVLFCFFYFENDLFQVEHLQRFPKRLLVHPTIILNRISISPLRHLKPCLFHRVIIRTVAHQIIFFLPTNPRILIIISIIIIIHHRLPSNNCHHNLITINIIITINNNNNNNSNNNNNRNTIKAIRHFLIKLNMKINNYFRRMKIRGSDKAISVYEKNFSYQTSLMSDMLFFVFVYNFGLSFSFHFCSVH